jgi:hypothetical protein
MKPRVFILEELETMNTTNADSFGRIVYLYSYSTRPCSIWDSQFIELVLTKLSEYHFDPKIDYFCMSGIMSACAMVLTGLVVEYGEFQCLLYDGSKYRSIKLGEAYSEEDSEDSENLNKETQNVGPSQANVL